MRARIAISAILAFLFVLGGTFAWQSYQQRAINPFYDPSGNHGIRFHDRLQLSDDPIRASDGYANMVAPNLNIFAENFADMDVLIRIQLREFFALNQDEQGFGGAYRDNPSSWPIFRTSDTNVMQPRYQTPTYAIYREGVSVHLGQPEGEDGRLVFMPTFNRAVVPATVAPTLHAPFNHHFVNQMSEATGAAVDWFTYPVDGAWVTSQIVTPHIRDYITYGVPTGPGVTDYADSHDPLTTERRRDLDDGTRDNWEIGDSLESRRVYTYDTGSAVELRATLTTYTHDAQHNLAWYVDMNTASAGATLPANFRGVMTLTQWHQLGRPDGDFWIHDSQDPNGWFYWMGYLEGDEYDLISNATSLLVESLELPDNPLEWEYALYMNGQAFTRPSIEMLYPSLSDAAWAIFGMTPPPIVGSTITFDFSGQMSLSQESINIGITPASFTIPVGTNAMGSTRSIVLPSRVDVSTLTVNVPTGMTYTLEGRTLTISGNPAWSVLPTAQVGCDRAGTPNNLWTDSTGIEWCVVATEGAYSMLISRRLHLVGEMNHPSPNFIRWPVTTQTPFVAGDITTGPQIRGQMNTWFNSNASNMLRASAVHANIAIGREVPAFTPADATIANDTNNLAMPIPGSDNGEPFFLSLADLHFRIDGNGGGALVATNAARIAYDTAGEARMWPLREAHWMAALPLGGVWAAGEWQFLAPDWPAAVGVGHRPAVWVRR